MKSVISTHNKQTPKTNHTEQKSKVKNSCLLDNKCLLSQFIHQDGVTNYLYDAKLGLAETFSRERYGRHKICVMRKFIRIIRNGQNMFQQTMFSKKLF